MSGPRPIADGQEVAHVVAALRKLGFDLVRRKRYGSESRYMRYGRVKWKLRVSDHENGRDAPDVLISEVVPYPVTATDVPLIALDIAIRFIACARDRKGLVREHAA